MATDEDRLAIQNMQGLAASLRKGLEAPIQAQQQQTQFGLQQLQQEQARARQLADLQSGQGFTTSERIAREQFQDKQRQAAEQFSSEQSALNRDQDEGQTPLQQSGETQAIDERFGATMDELIKATTFDLDSGSWTDPGDLDVLVGEIGSGKLDAVIDSIASTTGVPKEAVARAMMLRYGAAIAAAIPDIERGELFADDPAKARMLGQLRFMRDRLKQLGFGGTREPNVANVPSERLSPQGATTPPSVQRNNLPPASGPIRQAPRTTITPSGDILVPNSGR
jgi:hypothetical protein